MAGSTNALDFPTTPGAVQTECRCEDYAGEGFVTRLNADGSGLVWSTFLGGSPYGPSHAPDGVNVVSALALDAAGNVVVAGETDAADFPVTAGAMQAQLASPVDAIPRKTDGFLTKLSASGTALIFSTYLGGSANDAINAISIDPQGNVWATGTSASADFPGNAAPFTGSFYVETPLDGARLLSSQRTPGRASGQAICAAADGTLWVLGFPGSVLRMPGGQVQGVAVLGAASSAGVDVKGYVAPGEFISLYGAFPGPAAGAGATLDGDGRIAATLAGMQVLFNGIPAPLLYASSSQINALAPYELSGLDGATVQVTSAAGNSSTFQLYVEAAQPAVFGSGGVGAPRSAVALNQDGSLNSTANPAAHGSVVTIWASGAGLFNNQPPNGTIAGTGEYHPALPVAVLQNGLSIEVLSAAPLPGSVIDALQIDIRPPTPSDWRGFQLMIGGFISDTFAIAVQ